MDRMVFAAPSMSFQVIAEVGIQNDSSHPTRRILEAGLTETREVLLASRRLRAGKHERYS